ncbi:RagB/SusD family nutrient uptake outer membrane protein [Chryseobacterium sp. G0162]|uniref:RagB/SusD family nutrient uptake outer membrane protein n=1 Tax=Chryseobacterium sp. G0162 TaxID=2487063 RepID=UPI000F4F91F0|nr:RagB/SusD family nutrient uptake outer membrane protein [Chryseobacterium sp. G0162]AZB09067.1 RagB/SusD family nutrient uptake outer membrane protein [Chryseobacterium sp. G0162]
MKNIKTKINTLAIVSLGFLVTSCGEEGFLKQESPVNPPTETAINNEKTLQIAVNGLYNLMQTNSNGSQNSYGALIPTLNELLADNGFVSLRNSNRFSATRQPTLTFFVRQSGDIQTLWNSLYKIIANANYIISKEGTISDDITTPAQTPANLFAQAHLVRAMCYHTLVTFFADNIGGANQNLGVPIALKYDPSQKLSRSSVQAVYDQIKSDLNASQNINDINESTSGRTNLLGKAALDMMYSRYYLSIKDYANANVYSQKVLDNANYSLLPLSGVGSFFTAEGQPETIFELQYTPNDQPGANDGITATWYSGGRYRQNFATRAFYNQYSNTDVRKNAWYSLTGIGAPSITTFPDNPKPVDVKKYTTPDQDIIIMRKTEAVFNQLEALYYTNPASALTKLVTWVNTYRDPSYAFAGTGTALLDEILKQKNMEFFLEGFRYNDLKRNGRGFTNPQTTVTLSPGMKEFQAFPVPLQEQNANPNVQQYPGY